MYQLYQWPKGYHTFAFSREQRCPAYAPGFSNRPKTFGDGYFRRWVNNDPQFTLEDDQEYKFWTGCRRCLADLANSRELRARCQLGHDVFVEETAFGGRFHVAGANGEVAEVFAFESFFRVVADDGTEFVDNLVGRHRGLVEFVEA